MRLLRSGNEQELGAESSVPTASVSMTSLELLGRGRVVSFLGNDVVAMASIGRLNMGFDPDRVTVDPGGFAAPVEVELASINEWIYGAGLGVQRTFLQRWNAGLELDHRIFGLDTAHRKGDEIVFERETVGSWSARLGVWLDLWKPVVTGHGRERISR